MYQRGKGREGSGQQPSPHCTGLFLPGHRGRQCERAAPPRVLPAQLLREASLLLSHAVSCSGCSSGLWIGAVDLQCWFAFLSLSSLTGTGGKPLHVPIVLPRELGGGPRQHGFASTL